MFKLWFVWLPNKLLLLLLVVFNLDSGTWCKHLKIKSSPQKKLESSCIKSTNIRKSGNILFVIILKLWFNFFVYKNFRIVIQWTSQILIYLWNGKTITTTALLSSINCLGWVGKTVVFAKIFYNLQKYLQILILLWRGLGTSL